MTCVFREQTRKCCLVTGLHLFLITLCLPLGHFLLQSSRTLLQRLVLFNITLLLSSLVILWVPRNYRMEPAGYFDDRMLCNMALKQRHKSGWNGEKWMKNSPSHSKTGFHRAQCLQSFCLWLLFTLCLFMCNIPQGRAGGVAVLMDLLDGSRQFLVAAEDRWGWRNWWGPVRVKFWQAT